MGLSYLTVRPMAAWLGYWRYAFDKLTMCFTDQPTDALIRSIAVVLPTNRWAIEVRGSIAVVLPMNRWALQVRRSIAASLPTDRWIRKWLSHDLYVQPFDRWSCILSVSPMVLFFNDATWLCSFIRKTGGPLKIILGRLTDGTFSTNVN